MVCDLIILNTVIRAAFLKASIYAQCLETIYQWSEARRCIWLALKPLSFMNNARLQYPGLRLADFSDLLPKPYST